MSVSEPSLTGRQQLAAISRSIAGLQHEHYGRESTKVNAYAIKDMIVVVVRLKHLTPFEQSMVDGGEPERVLARRAEFARVMAGRYTQTVEQVTGRPLSRCSRRRTSTLTSWSRRSSSTAGSGQRSPRAWPR
jgi:uncharacterized protein YbcI